MKSITVQMRQLCRPFFTSHGLVLKWCYHVVTFIATRMSVDYCALAMKLLWISHIMTAWRLVIKSMLKSDCLFVCLFV